MLRVRQASSASCVIVAKSSLPMYTQTKGRKAYFNAQRHVFKNRLPPLIKNVARLPKPPNPDKHVVGVFHNEERLSNDVSSLYWRFPNIKNKSAYDPPFLWHEYVYDKSEFILEPFGSGKGIIMNRPFTLNAFDSQYLPMLIPLVKKYCHQPVTSMVTYLKGNTVFSSGTNFVDLYKNGTSEEGLNSSLEFLRQLYGMIHEVHNSESILMPVMNGLTLGSAASFAVNCPATAATPETEIAWPETSFGYFPDAGALYILSTLPNGIGCWLALTGSRLLSHTVMKAGLATYFYDMGTIKMMQKQMDIYPHVSKEQAWRFLELYSGLSHEPFELLPHLDVIERCFTNKFTIDEIMESLKFEGLQNAWAAKQYTRMLEKCPLSLVITLEAYRRADGLSIDRVLQQDFRLATRFLNSKDFYTGVKHYIIDKETGAPDWEYKSYKDVPESVVEAFFAPFDTADAEFFMFGKDYKYDMDGNLEELQNLYNEVANRHKPVRVDDQSGDPALHYTSALAPHPDIRNVIEREGWDSPEEVADNEESDGDGNDSDGDFEHNGPVPPKVVLKYSGDAVGILTHIARCNMEQLWEQERPISDAGKWGPDTIFECYEGLRQKFKILQPFVPDRDAIVDPEFKHMKNPEAPEKANLNIYDLDSTIVPFSNTDFVSRFPLDNDAVSEDSGEDFEAGDLPESDEDQYALESQAKSAPERTTTPNYTFDMDSE